MKARLEDGMLLVDFNYKGWNPKEVMEMSEKEFHAFKDKCESDYEGFRGMTLECLVSVLLEMQADGKLGF